MVLIPVHEDI